jgi:hypothetical protein
MEFGITDITNGWFYWFIKDKEKKAEMIASRYAEADFVKQFLVSLTELIRDKKEKSFSFFSEPGFTRLNMSIDKSNHFILEVACGHTDDFDHNDKEKAGPCCKFVTDTYQMRNEFVPTILKAFHRYQRSHLMLDYYEENWTVAIGSRNRENFLFPFRELQDLHQAASDIQPFALFREHGRYGYRSSSGKEIIIPPVYENGKKYPIVIKGRNYFIVQQNGCWGLVDDQNRTVIDFLFDDIGRVKLEKGRPQFLMCFQQQEGQDYFKIGIISTDLKITVYPCLDRFPENITCHGKTTCFYYINQGDKWGAVNRDGTVLMDVAYRKEEVERQIYFAFMDRTMVE